MLNRRESREVIVQALFTLDFRGGAEKVNSEDVFKYLLEEFYNQTEDTYSEKVFFGILEKIEQIDKIIGAAVSSGDFKKVALVDRNILRLGIFEMLFSKNNIPPRVAINEAIELAKTYGGKNAFKFISGVLGAVYENSKIKKTDQGIKGKKKDEDYESAPVIEKAGTIVFSIKDQELYFAMVNDLFGYWTLSKGKIDEKDKGDLMITAQRKIKEEIGIDVEILEKIGENTYKARNKDGAPIKNKVVYFLARAEYQPLKLERENEGLTDGKWFSIEKMEDLKIYDDLSKIIGTAIKIINEKYL